jgi:uncharacterized protein (TIGR02246 family)
VIADEQEIRGIIARQAEAWNRGDADGYGEACREDVGFTNILGMRWDTRAGFTARHAEMFASAFAGSHLVIDVERLLWLGPDLAVAELMTTLTGFRAVPPGIPVAADGSLRTRLLEVFVKHEAGWQIAVCHNTAVQEQRTSKK